MINRRRWLIVYWIVTGSLIGLGLIGFDILFLSLPCLLVGLSLGTVGIIRWGTRHIWIAFLALSMVPVFFLLTDIIGSSQTCPVQGPTIPANAPGGTIVTCGGVIPSTYYILLACFGGITLISGSWPILCRFMRR